MNDETQSNETEHHDLQPDTPPAFTETPQTLALAAIVNQYNELARAEFAKHPSNVQPVLLRRITPDNMDDVSDAETPQAFIIVDVNAKAPTPAPFAVGPQIGMPVPNLPGFFYTTAEAEKKYSNGHVFSDGQGARYKFITQETQNDGALANVTYWVRTTHPKKTEVK